MLRPRYFYLLFKRLAGLVEHYNGNEQVEDVMVMKFKKSAQEMLAIVHTHILSM